MERDLLERANELVAKTNATRRELASQLDRLEARAHAHQELEARMQSALSEEMQRSGVRILVSVLASIAAIIAIALWSEELPIDFLAALAGALVTMVGIFAARYERMLTRRVGRAVKRGKEPYG
jgi:Flp pilus assembly protein TadB